MLFQPCLPTPSKRVPSGPAWVHEINHDCYRLMVRRECSRVRLYTRRGYNWSHRFPLNIEAVVRSAVIDGEAVVCDENGVSDFEKLHSQGYDDHVVLYAFDLLELDGDDWRSRPLDERFHETDHIGLQPRTRILQRHRLVRTWSAYDSNHGSA